MHLESLLGFLTHVCIRSDVVLEFGYQVDRIHPLIEVKDLLLILINFALDVVDANSLQLGVNSLLRGQNTLQIFFHLLELGLLTC